MKRTWKLVAAGLLILAAAYAGLLLVTRGPDTGSVPSVFTRELMKTPLAGSDPLSDQYVRELRKYYGATIAEKSTQAALLGLRDYFMAGRQGTGENLFHTLLTRAFPGHADEILKTLADLDSYERWLEENRDMLLRMSPEERLAALWKQRTALFGEEAHRIFSGEMLATEARKAKVQDTLAVLNESQDTSVDDKLELYQGVLREAYADTPESYILEQKGILSTVFFSMDSVQDGLRRMDPEARRQEISRIRRSMGLTEEQAEAMAKRDADNELRWEIGLRYMEEREAVEKAYEDSEREEKIKELRERFFDDEANTIELEEKDGFFRFRRPRIYGRN